MKTASQSPDTNINTEKDEIKKGVRSLIKTRKLKQQEPILWLFSLLFSIPSLYLLSLSIAMEVKGVLLIGFLSIFGVLILVSIALIIKAIYNRNTYSLIPTFYSVTINYGMGKNRHIIVMIWQGKTTCIAKDEVDQVVLNVTMIKRSYSAGNTINISVTTEAGKIEMGIKPILLEETSLVELIKHSPEELKKGIEEAIKRWIAEKIQAIKTKNPLIQRGEEMLRTFSGNKHCLAIIQKGNRWKAITTSSSTTPHNSKIQVWIKLGTIKFTPNEGKIINISPSRKGDIA